MKTRIRQLFSLLLALTVALSTLPGTALAVIGEIPTTDYVGTVRLGDTFAPGDKISAYMYGDDKKLRDPSVFFLREVGGTAETDGGAVAEDYKSVEINFSPVYTAATDGTNTGFFAALEYEYKGADPDPSDDITTYYIKLEKDTVASENSAYYDYYTPAGLCAKSNNTYYQVSVLPNDLSAYNGVAFSKNGYEVYNYFITLPDAMGVYEDVTAWVVTSIQNGKIFFTAKTATYNPMDHMPWDYYSDTRWYSPDANEYVIYTAEELAGLAKLCNAAAASYETSFAGKTVKLGADIDLSGHIWTPFSFKGEWGEPVVIFDGQGYNITNLTVTQPYKYYAGLFAEASYARLQNFTVSGSVTVTDADSAGGVVGNAEGATLVNVGSLVDVAASGIENSRVYTGGLVGEASEGANILNCYAWGNVSATASGANGSAYAGGILGGLSNEDFVVNCYHAKGAVTAQGTNSAYGGIVGSNRGIESVINCFSSTNGNGDSHSDGATITDADALLTALNDSAVKSQITADYFVSPARWVMDGWPVFGPVYRLIQQPTAENEYTVAVNVPDDVVSYAWHRYERVTKTITDTLEENDDEYPVIYPGADCTGGTWTYSSPFDSYCLPFALNVQAGDVIKITPVGTTQIQTLTLLSLDYEALGGAVLEDGVYTITVPDYSGEAGLQIQYQNPPTSSDGVTATLTRMGAGSPVTGQESASFTGPESGAYVCKVTFPDNITLTSDPVDYTAPHIHSYSYSADGGVVTEACGGCRHSATATLAFTGNSADGLVYNGKAHTPAAAVTYSDNWAGGKPAAVSYENNTDAGTGTATASVDIEGQTASLNFSIQPLPVKLSWTGENFTHDGQTKTVTATVTNQVENDSVTVSTYTDNEKTQAGSYTAKATGLSNDNYTLDGGESLTHTWTIRPAAPEASAAVIHYDAETISFDKDIYEMNTAETFEGTNVPTDSSITKYISDYGTAENALQKLYIRTKAANGLPAGAPAAVVIPARPQDPAAPAIDYGGETVTLPDGAAYGIHATGTARPVYGATSDGSPVRVTDSIAASGATTNTIYYRAPATQSGFASAGASLELPARPASPAAPTVKTVTDAALTLNAVSGAEYRLGQGDWQDSPVFSGLDAAARYTLSVRIKATASAFCSAERTAQFYTRPAAPAVTEAEIDYQNETISFDSAFEMNTAADFKGTAIPSGGSITAYIANHGGTQNTLSIRRREANGVPASAATAVPIPARPATPAAPTVEETGTDSLSVTAAPGLEYTVNDWTGRSTTGRFTDLEPGATYTLRARVAAVEGSGFKSGESSASARTLTAFPAPTGSQNGRGSVRADKTQAAVGGTVTYTVTFADGYTPSLALSGNANPLPAPQKGENNTWTYTYTVHENDKTVGAAVTFAARRLESIAYTGAAVALFADSGHNATAAHLKAYLDGGVKVTPAYNNGTTGAAVSAVYTLTDGTWDARGGNYTYTAAAGGKTCRVDVAVKPVGAAIAAVSGITKPMTQAGYAAHAALGLPASAAVTYTGEGYTRRTETLPLTWSAIPENFGKTPGSHDFTGAVTLPAWATGGNTTTVAVTISHKTPLTQAQMPLVMEGWTYGDTPSTPDGSVTVADENGRLSYEYSADGGANWTQALPVSGAGAVRAGAYQVRMNYEGDGYIGSRTVECTVARKAVTLGAGTLSAHKTYDGGTAAPLTGAPALGGVLEGDAAAVQGGGGTYATANAGTGIAVAATGFTLEGADADNYTTTGTVSGLTGTIAPADGKTYAGYDAALEALQKLHIVTNVTPTLADVPLPEGWAFTGTQEELAKRLAGQNDAREQVFPVRYTPGDRNYAPVDLTGSDALFPVSTVAMIADSGLKMRTIEEINDTLLLSPVELQVTGAALPDSGRYAMKNMEWSSSVPSIATVAGAVAEREMSATITAKAKGVSMVGVAYKDGGGMLGYVLVQVMDNRSESTNTAADLKDITETLDKLISPANPSETDKMAVDAVAEELTKLSDAAKEALSVDDVRALDALKQAVGKSIADQDKQLKITIENDAEDQVPAPERVEVVGAAIACGVDSGHVVVTVRPVRPAGSDTRLELQLDMTVNQGTGAVSTELQAPMFFQIQVEEGIDLNRLTLYHVKDDDSKTVLPFERIPNSRTIAFKMTSFSSVQFVVPAGGSAGGGVTHTLTATAGGGGTISPSGEVRVPRNSGRTFTITPDEGYEIADVLVDGGSVGPVGSYLFEKVTKNHTIAASFRPAGERPAWNPFADVKRGDWYYDSVKYVYELGLMNGTGETAFSPDLSTTRGMIVTILWRLEGEPESGAAMTFQDVEAGSYCYGAVRWGGSHGIVKGYSAAAFGPEDPITRQELAVLLYRYARYKGCDVGALDGLTAFADRPDPWAETAVKWAVGAGLLTGRGGDVLDPRGQATRAQAAAVLHRFGAVFLPRQNPQA